MSSNTRRFPIRRSRALQRTIAKTLLPRLVAVQNKGSFTAYSLQTMLNQRGKRQNAKSQKNAERLRLPRRSSHLTDCVKKSPKPCQLTKVLSYLCVSCLAKAFRELGKMALWLQNGQTTRCRNCFSWDLDVNWARHCLLLGICFWPWHCDWDIDRGSELGKMAAKNPLGGRWICENRMGEVMFLDLNREVSGFLVWVHLARYVVMRLVVIRWWWNWQSWVQCTLGLVGNLSFDCGRCSDCENRRSQQSSLQRVFWIYNVVG